MQIRRATPNDGEAMSSIALRTADAGQDGTALYDDPTLFGQVWALPYLSIGPAVALIAEEQGQVIGYVVGTPDSRAFEAAAETDWWPERRARYSRRDDGSQDAAICALFHAPPRAAEMLLTDFPAHMHLNVAPDWQGRGVGPALAQSWLAQARAARVRGVHVGVLRRNLRGLAFWQRQGFRAPEGMDMPGEAIWLGTRLENP